MLSININHILGNLLQHTDRHRRAVDTADRFSCFAERTGNQKRPVLLRDNAVFRKLFRKRLRLYGKQRLNRRLLFSVAQKILPCSAAKGKLQRINNHGFAGTRFARQNIQPISKGDFAFLNQRHISDVQMFQHKASPPFRHYG